MAQRPVRSRRALALSTPQELLNFAAEMATDTREVAGRAASSRAYYAAFWHLRVVAISRFGPLEASGSEVHGELQSVIRLWDEELANKLKELRIVRNVADYMAAVPFPVARAVRSVATAREVLSAR